ncbi:MAG: preprotein translocase subunit Sec61beta [Candidatus Aenigmatarchaeota archaeon]
MARKDKIYMPMGSGGLLRYSEEGEEYIKIKPKQLVFISIGIIIFELVLKIFFG